MAEIYKFIVRNFGLFFTIVVALFYILSFLAKNYKKVLGFLIKIFPKRAFFYTLLGSLYQNDQEQQSAEKEFLKAIEVNPRYSVPYDFLIKMYPSPELKDMDALTTIAEVILSKQPDNPFALLIKGVAYAHDGDFEKAEQICQEAIITEPEFVYIFLNYYVWYLFNLKRYSEAEETLKRALEKLPNDIQLHQAYLGFLSITERYAEEEAYCHFMIEEKMDQANCYWQLAQLKQRAENYSEAEKFILKAIEINPGDAKFFSTLGSILWQLDKKEDAETNYLWTIKLDPKNHAAHLNLGSLYCFQLNQPEKGIILIKKSIELDPEESYGYFKLGLALEDQKILDEAEVNLRKAFTLNPESEEIIFEFAWFLFTHRINLDEAEQLFHDLLKINPQENSAYYNLACIKSIQGESDAVYPYLEKAIALNPLNRQSIMEDADFDWLRDETRMVELLAEPSLIDVPANEIK